MILIAWLAIAACILLGQGLGLRDPAFVGSGGEAVGGGGGNPNNDPNGAYTNTFVYYTFDNTLDDSRGTNHLTASGGTLRYTTGKIGDGKRMYDAITSITNSVFEFSDMDWAVRVWFFADASNSQGIISRSNGLGDPDYRGWNIANTTSSGWKARAYIGTEREWTDVITSTAALNTGEWNRVVFWVKSGVEIGLKVNNETSQIVAETDIMLEAPDAPLQLPRVATDIARTVDEVAIWRGYIPTEAELLWDWNDGAGRTYPLPEVEE
jgi:hypothetical protein